MLSRISARTVPTFQREMIPAETERMMILDLDADLQPASDREYVSLKKTDDDTDGEAESLEEKNSTEIFRVFTILYY